MCFSFIITLDFGFYLFESSAPCDSHKIPDIVFKGNRGWPCVRLAKWELQHPIVVVQTEGSLLRSFVREHHAVAAGAGLHIEHDSRLISIEQTEIVVDQIWNTIIITLF